MATIQIGGVDYPSYEDVEGASEYLAADFTRSSVWAAAAEVPEQQEKALVTASRRLAGLTWKDGVPDPDAPPAAVEQATAVYAADIISKPALADSPSSASNVKSVGAGPARVEFFGPTTGTPLPPAVYALLCPLLGSSASNSDDPALDNAAYGSENWRQSRFDPWDYELWPR